MFLALIQFLLGLCFESNEVFLPFSTLSSVSVLASFLAVVTLMEPFLVNRHVPPWSSGFLSELFYLRSYGVDWEGLCSQEFSSYIYASGTAVYVCTPVVRWLILSFPSSCRDKGTITLRLWWSSSTRMHIIVLRMQVRSANGCQNGSR